MYSNKQRKLILQLNKKKFRESNKLFVAEGKKVVSELISADWSFRMLFSTDDNFHKKAKLIKEQEMKKITHFKTNFKKLWSRHYIYSLLFIQNSTYIS